MPKKITSTRQSKLDNSDDEEYRGQADSRTSKASKSHQAMSLTSHIKTRQSVQRDS